MLAIQIGLLSWLLYTAIGDGHFFLAHDDEVINYCAAKLYDETGSVRAEGCITEDVSPIGQMNWYGPGYYFVYGSLRTLFGDHSTLFIQLHFAFALLAVLLIYFLPGKSENKLLIANALVFTWQFTGYIFTWFPETLNLLMAILMILLVVGIKKAENHKYKNYLTFIFIGVVLTFALCRVTIIFWLAALIGLSTTKREVVKTTIIFGTGLLLTLVYMKYFTAPPYAGEMQKIGRLYKFDMIQFVLRTGWALLRNTWFLIINFSMPVYFLLGLMGLAAFQWWKSRDRLLMAALLVSLLLVAALMAYYSPDPWYFLKQSDALIPLLLMALMLSDTSLKIKYGIVMVAIMSFIFSFQKVMNTIHERREAYGWLEEHKSFQASLQQVPAFIDEEGPVTILWCYNEYAFGGVAEALLPFSTRHHKPILYTSNIVDPAEKSEVKFQRHHKIQVDYILSRLPIGWPELEEVHASGFYHLYKIIDNKK